MDLYILIILIILFFISYVLKILDLKGSIFAFILGFTVTYFGSIYYLILLLLFVFVSYLSTKYKFQIKKNISDFEKTRSWRSVISKGIFPFIIVLLPLNNILKEVLFSVAVAAATSDTLSGELGILSRSAFLITNLKRAKPGENGAVSFLGEFWAIIGSLIIGIFSYLFFNINLIEFLIIIIFGFLGSQFDSILGAIYENNGKLKKFSVNILAIGISIILAYLFLL